MNERKILPFIRPEKTKADTYTENIREYTPEEEENFILKCAWVVETLHALKKADPHSIKSRNIQIRRDLVRGSSPDYLKDIIMEANSLRIVKDPSYYEAVTDEIYERKLNRLKQ